MTNDKSQKLVSICCITYNHAPFIRQCLDGFLMQEPPTGVPADEPWYEILIHDDASTDGAAEIIKEYAAKYPNLIFPLYEEVNQYSQGKENIIDMYNYGRARGKYIAYCEGDDYWTDPHKLQKQVDFMEAHTDYSVCFHCFRNYIAEKDLYIENTLPTQLIKQHGAIDGIDIDMDLFWSNWYTQPMTMLFRVSMADFSIHKRFRYCRDLHDIYFLIKAGKCRLLNFEGGVRNVHKDGVASMISQKRFCEVSLPIDREFYWKIRDSYAKKQYLDTLEKCVTVYAKSKPFKALRYALIIFFLTGHPHSLWRNFKLIFA